MPVDQTLAKFSDIAFGTTFFIYCLALLLSLVFYMKQRSIVDDRREAKNPVAKELVTVGSNQSGGVDSAETPTVEVGFTDKEHQVRKLSNMTQSLVWLGIIVHFASIVLRGLSASRFPLSNLYEYVAGITFFTMVIAAVTLQRPQLRTMWPWILTPMLALLFFGGTKLYADSAPVVPALQSLWRPVHVVSVSVGASIGMISGLVSLLYLLRMWQQPGKEHGFFGGLAKPLPAAKTLDAIAYRTAIWTVPILGLGIILGAIWAESAWGRFWGWDPKETFALISWVLYAAYLHARSTAGWRDTKAAWINVLAMATMVFNLFFINMIVSGLHSYAGLN